jgi:hypothetical protein
MKENSMKIKKVDSGVNSIPMEIFILAIFHKIKNMGKGHSIGLAYVLLLALRKQVLRFSSIMGIGGVACLMAKDNIKKLMVNFN